MKRRAIDRGRGLGTAALAIAAAALIGGCRSTPTAPKWGLIWQDEFDGPASQALDPTRWGYDIGTDWGNAQLEYDTSRPVNVALDGAGHLAIVARKETYLGQPYTSARINTRGLFAQQQGRFEARIKLPSGQGVWPAFWMLGSNYNGKNWPDCGEIDIMENFGQDPSVVHGSLHGPGYSGSAALTGKYQLAQGRFDDGFHVFALEWTSDRITYFVDGSAYQSLQRSDIPSSGRWVFDHPFFILLNVAVGGGPAGPPSPATAFPQTMLVDYVRVYAVGP
jgi:beta-glucanase (GH16 family)